MRFRKSFSAVCYHFGRDAVRPDVLKRLCKYLHFIFTTQVIEWLFLSLPQLNPSTYDHQRL